MKQKLKYYYMPVLTVGWMNFLVANYLMKFATDILYLTPAFMGTIFLISRVWDAVNDPIAGVLCDRTQSRFGRRKIWIISSVIPIILSFLLLWYTPGGNSLLSKIWMTSGMLLFFTALTVFYVPHYALGMELARDYTGRNRLFGLRAITENSGVFLAVFTVGILANITLNSGMILLIMGSLTLVIFSFLFYRKIDELELLYQQPPLLSLKDLIQNRPALLIISAGFFTQAGATLLMSVSLYFAQYVLHQTDLGPLLMAFFMIPATLSIPLWIYAGRKYKKHTLWYFALSLLSIILIMLYPASIMFSTGYFLAICAIAGVFAGAPLMLHPSLLSDSADFGMDKSGRSQAASYFAMFTLVNKGAMAIAAAAVLYALSFSGFAPNQVQPESVKMTLKIMLSVVPGSCMLIAVLLLLPLSVRRDLYQFSRKHLTT